MTFSELCSREVVQIDSGVCLGRVDDIVFSGDSARIERLIMLGRPRLFGLLGREESLEILWEDVVNLGVDALLVKTLLPERLAHPTKHRFSFL